jgi:hypothetical protein
MGAAKFHLDLVDGLVDVPRQGVATPKRPPPLDTVPIPSSASSHPTTRPQLSADQVLTFESAPEGTLVPVRTRRSSSSAQIDHRAAFVLMHVDGVMEVPTIARLVGFPVDEVRACFEELISAGLVELVPPRPAPPSDSGVFPCLAPRR